MSHCTVWSRLSNVVCAIAVTAGLNPPPHSHVNLKQNTSHVVKAIRESPLQLQARVEGKEVHVPVPKCVYLESWHLSVALPLITFVLCFTYY